MDRAQARRYWAIGDLTFGWKDRSAEFRVSIPTKPEFQPQIVVPTVPPRKRPYDRSSIKTQDEGAGRLATPVTICLGTTTLDAVAKHMSKASGVPIEAADYLGAHQLFVFTRGVPPRAIMDALCNECGWKWQADEVGVIHIDRREPSVPRSMLDMYRALFASLPVEWQRFISATNASAAPDIQTVTLLKSGLYYDAIAVPALRQRIREASSALAVSIRDSLRENDARVERVSFKDLSAEQQRNVTSALILNAVARICNSPTAPAIFFRSPAPYQVDPGGAEIRFQNGGIMVLYVREIQGQRFESGFGASICEPGR